jgi:hypothetical protein
MDKKWIAPIVLLTVVVAGTVVGFSKKNKNENAFANASTKEIMDRKEELPCLWLYYNTEDVNSRHWADFGSRSSRVINKPYLNLCYETIVKAAGQNYRIEIIRGVEDAIQRLGGPEFVPSPFKNPKGFLLEEEVHFLGVAFLAKFGGLWMSPSTICLKDIPVMPCDSIVGFGTSDTDTYSGTAGTIVPNTSYLWSPQPGHPVFVKWASMLFERLDGYQGGQRVRRDPQWDWTFVTSGCTQTTIWPWATLQRKKNGRRIELTDLLMAGTEGEIPFPIPANTFMVPIPYYELERRSKVGWFLRMSEDQIMDSDLVIRWLFEKANA